MPPRNEPTAPARPRRPAAARRLRLDRHRRPPRGGDRVGSGPARDHRRQPQTTGRGDPDRAAPAHRRPVPSPCQALARPPGPVGRAVRVEQDLHRVAGAARPSRTRSASGRSRSRRPPSAAPDALTLSNSGAPTSIAMSYFSLLSPYVPAIPQQSWSMSRARRPGHEREQVERREPDPVAPQLARRVVREVLVERAEAGVEPALLVEVEQELADVPGRLGDDPRVVVVEVEHLLVLGLEACGCTRSRCRRSGSPARA